jgi:hypothetical protein
MIKFEFKQTNQELTAHYCSPAPMTGGSVGGTVWFKKTLALPPVQASTSPPTSGTAQQADVTASRAGGSSIQRNQPKSHRTLFCMVSFSSLRSKMEEAV